ncbi:MAG: D-alanyl-D-alanine carboxypeptidase [Spirochaetales bacterium]|nr:D-alanyl-D-alanine carboxypeptidase [Spirochaetales bacterium]
MKKTLLLLFLIFLSLQAFAQNIPAPPEINSKSAIMIDAETGQILYEKNPDEQIPPASMTKLMTIYTTLELVREGNANIDDIVPISDSADFRNAPPHSSLMFLEKGQKVTLKELLQGMALPSGNDAGIAVAEYLAGSVNNFIKLMNNNAKKLGMTHTSFDDSSGYSALNTTTARDFANFCKIYVEKNKDYLELLHCPKSFTYPQKHNLPPSGESVHGPITQGNHNMLIGRLEGVDGLKTGFIEESGYNIAVTAQKDGRRIILILMGGTGKNAMDGSVRRAIDATYLLGYGFYGWTEYTPELPKDEKIRIYGGNKKNLDVLFSNGEKTFIRTELIPELKIRAYTDKIKLPVIIGSSVGKWQLEDGNGNIYQSGTITARENIKEGNIFKRIFDKPKRNE